MGLSLRGLVTLRRRRSVSAARAPPGPAPVSFMVDHDTHEHIVALTARGWDVLAPGTRESVQADVDALQAEVDVLTQHLRTLIPLAQMTGNAAAALPGAVDQLQETRAALTRAELRAGNAEVEASALAAIAVGAMLEEE